LLVVITVVGSDKDRVVNVNKVDILILDISDRTLSTGPGLDTNTVLTIGTLAVQDADSLNVLGSTGFTK
jgi:hypothetical protein